ncbi:MAG: ArsR/SmtB family transcription factor [Acidimicrobiales bacterium]
MGSGRLPSSGACRSWPPDGRRTWWRPPGRAVGRRSVELLAAGPRRAGNLASALGVSAPTMSKHLRALHHGGLVTDTAPTFDTRVRIYQLRAEPLADLHRWRADTGRAWSD